MCPEVLACIVDIKYIFLSDLNESPVYTLMWFEETLGGEKSLYFEKIKSFICTKPLWNLMFCHAHWHVWVLSVVCLSHASFNFSNKYDYVYNPKLPEISLSLHSWRNRWGTAYRDWFTRLCAKKITLEKSNYATAAAQLQFNFLCCNPINPAPFYSLQLLHWATICYNCEWEIFFYHTFARG